MPISREAPKPETYTFVVQRYNLACIQSQNFNTYAEVVDSVAVAIGDEPEAQTLFINSKPAYDRACALGWTCVTEQWNNHLEDSIVKPTTDSQEAIYSILSADEWMSKKDIIEAAGIPSSQWRTSIQILQQKKLVKCSVTARDKKAGASKKHYFYKKIVN